MTIKRQYSLPNCTLTLEGMSNDTATSAVDSRPLLAILVNAECRFSEPPQALSGGRDFFISLVKSVSAYAQEFLSGIHHPQIHQNSLELIELSTLKDKGLHRLTRNPDEEDSGVKAPVHLDLTTVQLFDLVEAVDQFLADSRTLPEISVPLQPVSKRYRQAEVPIVQRVVPPALGIGSLALAAAALFFVPVPEVREPEPVRQEESSPVNEDGETNSTDNLPGDEPDEDEEDGDEEALNENGDEQEKDSEALNEDEDGETTELPTEESNLGDSPVNTATQKPATSTNPTNTDQSSRPTSTPNNSLQTAVNLSAKEIEELLASAQEITDPNDLYYIQKYVRSRLYETWQDRDGFNGKLEYRVSVAKDGTIYDYDPVEDTPTGAAANTPLPDISYTSVSNRAVSNQPAIAQFRVAFTEQGVIEISPWNGFPRKPTFRSDITNPDKLEELSNQLRRTIHEAWDGSVSYEKGLIYRIAVTQEGKIADFDYGHQPASDYLREVPLDSLVNPEAAGIGSAQTGSVIPQQPLAQFRVVFKPNGVLEISRW